ncbi:hypothetical protein [Microbacterium thalassium]|uniref:Uncharacterized protein n=1 Tax=Microbacterium thalassium TaxID=362649 RepID=A0A7X0KTM2_9MICO|nr:hypothetical protein [Microbacterium thalassium]MBB6390198.1 hypothetical protein [Microbacterium thalassium]GLK25306.1 hypothetical protein GCM10017607_26250 [Microbacterium thalassium]
MTARELGWGVPIWAIAVAAYLFASQGPISQWDISTGSAIGIVVGYVLGSVAVAGLVWLPAAVAATRGLRSPWLGVAAVVALGFVIGFLGHLLFALASAGMSADWAYVLGLLAQFGIVTAFASLLGWFAGLLAHRSAQRGVQRHRIAA